MILTVKKDTQDSLSGSIYVDGKRVAYTRESAPLPVGSYKILVTWSYRFNKYLPEIIDDTGTSLGRIYGDDVSDAAGIMVGKMKTETGVAKCVDTINALIDLIDQSV